MTVSVHKSRQKIKIMLMVKTNRGNCKLVLRKLDSFRIFEGIEVGGLDVRVEGRGWQDIA